MKVKALFEQIKALEPTSFFAKHDCRLALIASYSQGSAEPWEKRTQRGGGGLEFGV